MTNLKSTPVGHHIKWNLVKLKDTSEWSIQKSLLWLLLLFKVVIIYLIIPPQCLNIIYVIIYVKLTQPQEEPPGRAILTSLACLFLKTCQGLDSQHPIRVLSILLPLSGAFHMWDIHCLSISPSVEHRAVGGLGITLLACKLREGLLRTAWFPVN